VKGKVIAISNEVYSVRLKNGHEVTAYFDRNTLSEVLPTVGSEIVLKLSPYDLTRGRIVKR